MLRRTARLRKEYLYRRSLETKRKEICEKKRKVREALKQNKKVPTEIRALEAASLYKTLDLDDIMRQNPNNNSSIDDEYAYAGLEDPRILITTCRNPSSRLVQFSKELKILFPNAEKINRGSYIIKDIVNLSKNYRVTDVIIVHEHRGVPDGMIISHMPLGPTAYFSILDVTMRHDLPEKPKQMSLVNPHLIFENFTSPLGIRISNILKYLFPPVRSDSKRVCAFVNQDDIIAFRHHVWAEKPNANDKEKHSIELTEVGPRISFKLYRLDIGTLDERFAETEWTLRPFFNKQKFALAN